MKLFYLTPLLLLLSIQSLAKTEFRAGKDFALFIAVKDYDHWPSLKNPIKDARAIAEELHEVYAFDTEVLENPTRQEIYQAINSYQQKVFPDDAQLFIFFSGHGEFIPESSQGFFIPSDGLSSAEDPYQDTYIPLNRLKGLINNISCNHILLAIDACYSGTIDEGVALKGDKEVGQLENGQLSAQQQNYIKQVMKLKSRLYLTSGGKERTPDGVNHSPFTEKVLACLRYGIESKLITSGTLFSSMEGVIPRPHWGKFGIHENGGDFLLIKKNEFSPNSSSSLNTESSNENEEQKVEYIVNEMLRNTINAGSEELADILKLDAEKKYSFKAAGKALESFQRKTNKVNLSDCWDKIWRSAALWKKDYEYLKLLSDFLFTLTTSDNKDDLLRELNRLYPGNKVSENLEEWTAVALINTLNSRPEKNKNEALLIQLDSITSKIILVGSDEFENKNHLKAMEYFKINAYIYQILEASGHLFKKKRSGTFYDQIYYTGLAILYLEEQDLTEPIFQFLYNNNYNKAAVYEALFKIKSSKKP